MEVINALGRRKAAVARVYVKEGKATSQSMIVISRITFRRRHFSMLFYSH
jgi:ribosomal protein S9